MKFAYWNIRGLGEPIRLMLEYSGLKYEEKRYEYPKTEDQWPKAEWLKEKNSLGLTFPNLPYLIDGDVKMTESVGIAKHLAKRMDLMPLTDQELRDCDMVYGVAFDLRVEMATLVYFPDMDKNSEEMKKKTKIILKQLDDFLKGQTFVVGEKLTYVDFNLYEVLDHYRLLFPDIYDDTTNVMDFMKRFEALDGIRAYHQSDRYHKFPIFATPAYWGGKDYDDRT